MNLHRDSSQILAAPDRRGAGRKRALPPWGTRFLYFAATTVAAASLSAGAAEASVSFQGPVSAVVLHNGHHSSAIVRKAVATVSLPTGWKPVYLGRHAAGAFPDHFALHATAAGRACSLQATLINQPVLTPNLPTSHNGGITDETPVGPLGRPFNVGEVRHRAGSVRIKTPSGTRTEGGVSYIAPFGDGRNLTAADSADLLGLAVFRAPLLHGVPSADRWAHAFIDVHWADPGVVSSPCLSWAREHAQSAAALALDSVAVRA